MRISDWSSDVCSSDLCAIAFRVKDAPAACRRAREMGAWVVESTAGPMALHIPAIQGIGDSLLYLVDRYGDNGPLHDVYFNPLPCPDQRPEGAVLTVIAHLTHHIHPRSLTENTETHPSSKTAVTK